MGVLFVLGLATSCSADNAIRSVARPARSFAGDTAWGGAYGSFLAKCRGDRLVEVEIDVRGLATADLTYYWSLADYTRHQVNMPLTDFPFVRGEVLVGDGDMRGIHARREPAVPARVTGQMLVRLQFKSFPEDPVAVSTPDGEPVRLRNLFLTLLVKGKDVDAGWVLTAPQSWHRC